MFYDGYPKYVPVAEREEKALKTVAKLKKSRPDLAPVSLQTNSLARTWWAKAWNKNLESYADYAYRISRGRSYVRHRAVVHLGLKAGQIEALVQGGERHPYEVTVHIKALPKDTWTALVDSCAGQIDSLAELIEGRFPKALSELFTAKGSGLFPTPQEIRMSCSCPDGAHMCKHVAAVMYGIGVRLDENPSLLFSLRGVEIEALISTAISEKSERLLQKSGRRSARVLDDDVSTLFGIELETEEPKIGPAKVAASTSTPAAAKANKAKTPTSRKKASTRAQSLDTRD